VTVKKQLSFSQISRFLDIPEEELQYLNPSYKRMVIPYSPDEPNTLTLPSSKLGVFIANEEDIYNKGKDSIHSQDVLSTQETIKIHTVKSGEHLSTIAKRYGCTVADIKLWNGIKSSTVKTGKKLTIYVYGKKPLEKKTAATVENKTTTNNTSNNNNGAAEKHKYHTVQKGDSLYKISTKYKTTVDELKRLNNFGTKYSLIPGKKIKVGSL